jgi:hypothetical protein
VSPTGRTCPVRTTSESGSPTCFTAALAGVRESRSRSGETPARRPLHSSRRCSRDVLPFARSDSTLVARLEDDGLPEPLACHMKRVAPRRPDQRVAWSIAPFPRTIGRKAQTRSPLAWESGPRIEPQLMGSAELSPGDHDFRGVRRRDCPERLVVVPAVVAPGVHRVANDAIARAKAYEHRAFAIREGDGAHVGPDSRSNLGWTSRAASPSICAESWLRVTGSLRFTSSSEEACADSHRRPQYEQPNPHARRPDLCSLRGSLVGIRGHDWIRSRRTVLPLPPGSRRPR